MCMKQLILAGWLGVCLLSAGHVYAQSGNDAEKLGLPGDNLNLYAVMKIFQESPTLEEFEKTLNEEDSKINNLDLNGDDETDYIKVIDEVEGTVHNIILQVAVSATENQDIAVFTVDKDDKGNIDMQLTGDEELYGKDYIIEPNISEAGATPNPGYAGNSVASNENIRVLDDKQIVVNSFSTVEIRTWPIITFMFVPSYTIWRSPWYWGHYPGWYRPWRPLYWDYYYGYHYNFYDQYWGWYRRWPHHRRPYWNDYYYRRHRAYSPWVNNRRMGGYYQNTYSRPDLRKDGIAQYNKINPARPVLRPGLNKPAPKPTPRPVVTRPTNPGIKPVSPITRPTNPVTKPTNPVTRPTNPVTKPTKPVTRPTNPVTKPVTRPTTPVTKPITRPTTPATRPVTTRPATKPATTRPATTRPATTRPATRPATAKPATRPAPKKVND